MGIANDSARPSRRSTMFTADSKIGLTIGNLVSIIMLVVAGVAAWQKIPSSDDVKDITTASIQQANMAAKERNKETDNRLSNLEHQYSSVNTQLVEMNKRMDTMLILMAGSTADDIKRSPRARNAAKQMRSRLENGEDPLEGLPLDRP